MSNNTKSAGPLDALVSIYVAAVESANRIAQTVQASKGDSAKSVKEWRETSDDAAAVEYREWYEKAQAAILAKQDAINAKAAEALGVKTLSEDDVKALEEQYKPFAAEAKTAKGLLTNMSELLKIDAPEVPDLLRFKSGKAGGATGNATGIRRPRFDRVEVNGTTVKNLSEVSALIKKESGVSVSAKELQVALFESAGTDDMDKFSDTEILWSETVDGTQHNYSITAFKSHAAEVTPEVTESE
jgi:hypothetical protein